MDTKKVTSKRETRGKKMQQSDGDDLVKGANPSKRRRIHEPATQEPEPKEIDPLVGKFKSMEAVQSPTESNSKQHAATVASISVRPYALTKATPSNHYVPMPPPTVEQVADLLLQPKAITNKKKNKLQVTPPKPPPPTPAMLGPRPPNNATKSTKPSTRTAHHRQRSFFYRIVTFVWFAVMLKVTLGFVAPNELLLQKIRASVLPFLHAKPPAARMYSHVKPPLHVDGSEPQHKVLANMTLRDFLADDEGFHLALAPAFFGIYAYVGTFMAWDGTNYFDKMKSVAGASAGAMAAVILAAGIDPHKVADLGRNMKLENFADPPGIGGLFKGNKFEEIMEEFFRTETRNNTMLMEDSIIPVAVTAFDLKSMQGRILTQGSMAKAARASATFPLLFQPVRHENGILIDGGVTDTLGLRGLAAFNPDRPKRVVNVVVGGFFSAPLGPQFMPKGVNAKEVLSISILNTPQCGPWAMANGPRAIEAARQAMLASLDLPLYYGQEKGHYELHVDASSYVE